MKKLLILCITLISLSGFGQSNEKYSLRFSNKLGDNIIVHTVALNETKVKCTDTDDTPKLAVEIEESISFLKGQNGIKQVSFDQSTSTFTIVSNEQVSLIEELQFLNSKSE